TELMPGRLDGKVCVITGAGGGMGADAAQLFTEEGAKVVVADVNLKAAFFLARSAGRAMIEQGKGGRIILFSSQGWWTGGFGGSVAYAATKGGITTACRGLARTFGPHGITVNCVSPGQVNTPMLMTGLAPEIYENMKKQTPLGYVAEPVEMAGPVVFLASDHASYITGSTINASGGFLMY
ncbi:MAG: SDR family oxidoreductase, partial [Chloroflexi bacterium]|nr:SDR family oxidoreductase [Chloroflexota bacterium]